MSKGVTAYKYIIPLEVIDGVDRPSYETPTAGERLSTRHNSNTLEVVQTEAAPHFHKDSINVSVEKVDAINYGYEPELDTTDNEQDQTTDGDRGE